MSTVRRKILIADDVEINRALLKNMFEDEFDIIEAEDGKQTIRLIDEHRQELSIVFLDLIMPKKTGLEVLLHMKKKELLSEIPVILITAEASNESDLKTYEIGAADIIYKPFSRRVVKRRAKNLIELYESKRSQRMICENALQVIERIKDAGEGMLPEDLMRDILQVESEIHEILN